MIRGLVMLALFVNLDHIIRSCHLCGLSVGLQSCTSDDDDVVFRVLIYQFHIKVSLWFNPTVDIDQMNVKLGEY